MSQGEGLPFITAVAAYLAYAADGEAGESLYDAQDPDAMVMHDGRVCQLRSVDRASYAATHRALSRAWHAASPERPRAPALLLQAETAVIDGDGPDRAVLRASATDTVGAREVHLAAGLTRHGDGRLAIAWCLVTEHPTPMSYAGGRALTLAEYPYANTALPPRTWLDVSYHRLYGLPTPPLLVLPEARFSCGGSGACCRMDFDVVLPASAQAFIDALPWETLAPALAGTRLAERPDGTVQLKGPDEPCRFLDERNHCLIHKAIGRSVFEPCTVFPYAFAQTPEGVAVGTSSLCSSARADLGAPLQSNAKDIYARMAIGTVRHTEAYRLTSEQAVPWETFRDAEAALLAILRRSDLPFYRRLWIGTRLLPAWAAGQHQPSPEWESEPIARHEPEDVHALAGFFDQLPPWILRAFDDGPLPAVAHAHLREEALLLGQMANLIQAKRWSYPYDLMTAHNLMIMLYVMTLVIQAPFQGAPLPERARQIGGLLVSHNDFFPSLADGHYPEIAAIAPLLRSPIYGQWLLGYPN